MNGHAGITVEVVECIRLLRNTIGKKEEHGNFEGNPDLKGQEKEEIILIYLRNCLSRAESRECSVMKFKKGFQEEVEQY